jgi:hypothetical protein
MQKPQQQQIFSIDSPAKFQEAALQVFRYQAHNCAVYKQFIGGLNIDVAAVSRLCDIPFLPIEFFKQHRVVSSGDEPEITLPVRAPRA